MIEPMARFYQGPQETTFILLNDRECTLLKRTKEEEESLDRLANECLKTYQSTTFPLHEACAVFSEDKVTKKGLVAYHKAVIKEIKQELTHLLESDREFTQTKPREELEWYLLSNQNQRDFLLQKKVDTEFSLELLGSGKKRKQSADFLLAIEKAKLYPVDKLVTFVRRKALCVWHQDSDPSMHYYPKKNNVWCFSCERGGDAVDVYQAMKECSLKEAVEYLSGQS